MIRLFGALLLCAIALAEQAAPRMARISGRVVNQAGEPVRRAAVRLLGNTVYTQTANVEGAFVLDDVLPGPYSLVAFGSGYAVQKFGAELPLIQHCPNSDTVASPTATEVALQYARRCIVGAPGATLSLAAGQELKGLRIKLTRNAAISGRVLNQDGEAVRGWSVDLVKVKPGSGEQTGVLQSSTNVDGDFAFANAAPGRYYLYASRGFAWNMKAGFPERQTQAPQEIDLPTYYPDGAAIGRVTPIEVKPGDELSGLTIHLRRGRVYAIRGRIDAPPDSGVGDQFLTLASQGEPSGLVMDRRTSVLTDGSFEFRDLTPGVYVITGGFANSAKLGAVPLYVRAEVNVASSDVEGLTLTAVPTLQLRGTISMEAGKLAGDWPHLSFREVSDNLAVGATPNKSGAFTVRNRISLSKYIVNLTTVPEGTYVESARYSGQDLLRAPLDLTGGASGSLDIVLSGKVATITGSVTNAKDEPAAGFVVSVWPRTPLGFGRGAGTASTDQNGYFRISDLGPGDYFVAAWEDLEPGLADYPDFLTRFQSEAATVRLEEGGQAKAELRLISRERIASETAKLP